MYFKLKRRINGEIIMSLNMIIAISFDNEVVEIALIREISGSVACIFVNFLL